jgi:lipoate-protein ligase A
MDPVRTASVMGVSVEGVVKTTTTLREQLGRAIGYEDLGRLLRDAFEDTLGVRLAEGGLSPAEESLKERLLAEKYGTDRWNLEGKGDPGEDADPAAP